MPRVPAMRTLENALRRAGFACVAGVDEVGRGCLAGPVVAAAVVLHPDRHVPGVCDSKAVRSVERERLYDTILTRAVAWAVGAADPAEIDRINIHQASLRAMQRAIVALVPLPDMVLVDAFRVPDLPMAQRGVKHGDRRCSAIAAASIVAKVTARPPDAGAARPRSALRLRSAQGICHRRSSRARFRALATRRRTVDRFGRRRCLIPLTRSPSAATRPRRHSAQC